MNPSSLDVARAAAPRSPYVEDKTQEFEAEAAKALAISPRYGEVYRVAGEMAAHNYRFDEAVALTRRALALDPGERPHAGRPRRCTCCAPATSRPRAPRSTPPSRPIRTTPSPSIRCG